MGIASMIYNGHPEPYPKSKFRVFIQGMPLGFSKISNIENSYETDPIQEGGVNDRVYSLSKAVTSEKIMVFERGMAGRGLLAMLMTLRFAAGQRLTNDVLIMVGDRSGAICSLMVLSGVFVRSWKTEDLDASSSDVWIERFEVTYEKLHTYPLVAGGLGGIMSLAGLSAF